MTAIRVFVPRDAAAVACGADELAVALTAAAKKQKVEIQIVRNGSRGMLWLEPLVEIEDESGARYGFGPAEPGDADALIKALAAKTAAKDIKHKLSVGLVEKIPFFAKQTRLTFARCGITDPVSLADYKAHGGYKEYYGFMPSAQKCISVFVPMLFLCTVALGQQAGTLLASGKMASFSSPSTLWSVRPGRGLNMSGVALPGTVT